MYRCLSLKYFSFLLKQVFDKLNSFLGKLVKNETESLQVNVRVSVLQVIFCICSKQFWELFISNFPSTLNLNLTKEKDNL